MDLFKRLIFGLVYRKITSFSCYAVTIAINALLVVGGTIGYPNNFLISVYL